MRPNGNYEGPVEIRRGLPQTTRRDVADLVDEIGEGVTVVSVGDRVYGADDGAGAAELALLTYRAPIPVSLVSSTEPPSPWHSKQHSATAFTATPFTRLLK